MTEKNYVMELWKYLVSDFIASLFKVSAVKLCGSAFIVKGNRTGSIFPA